MLGWALAVHAEIRWLESQMRPLRTDAVLIQSFTDRSQSYLYDQALAIIAFTRAGEQANAKKLVHALEQLQNADGTWYFSYYLDGKSPHPEEGDMRPHGAIAWAALAILTYENASKDLSYRKVWKKTLTHLESHIVFIPRLKRHGLTFSSVDNIKTAWDEREVAALEHALDAVATFRLAHQLTQDMRWKKAQKRLEEFSVSLWDEAEGHFWSGANVLTGKINRGEFYLDNQSWSALALSHLPLKDKLRSALKASCRLSVVSGTRHGFTESRSPASQQEFIWSEGTAGKALALHFQEAQCAGTETSRYLDTLESMKLAGGVRYVDRPHVIDFTDAPSVAGTVWTWFLRHKINPLDV
jgi:hypothetical protein